MDWAKFAKFFVSYIEENPQLVKEAFTVLLTMFVNSKGMQDASVVWLTNYLNNNTPNQVKTS